MNKRASETMISEIVLIIFSVLLFSILLVFVTKTANSSLYYEEIYSKKIGLAIEASSSGSVLIFDISKPYEISKINKLFKDKFEVSFRKEFFYFSNDDSSVQIKMGDQGGFKFKLMSNRTVKNSTMVINEKSKDLIIELGGKR